MCHGRVKDAASYETVTHSPPCAGQRHPARRGGTRRCRPTSGTVACSGFGGNGKAAAHHPARGGDGGFGAVGDGPGDCAICGWRFGTMGDFAPCAARVFRWLRPAGVSPRARGDQRLCLWKPRFFEKNRVKLLYLGTFLSFGASGVTAYCAGTPKSPPRWYPASPWA